MPRDLIDPNAQNTAKFLPHSGQNAKSCDACGEAMLPTFRYCRSNCIQTLSGYVAVDTYDRSTGAPHLHRTCPVCGYEWLEETATRLA